MDVGVRLSVALIHGVDDSVGVLRRGAIVKID